MRKLINKFITLSIHHPTPLNLLLTKLVEIKNLHWLKVKGKIINQRIYLTQLMSTIIPKGRM